MRIRVVPVVAAVIVVSMLGLPPAAAAQHRSSSAKPLRISVTGLPGSSKARIKVTGPHTFTRTSRVASTWKLKGLSPGRYTVTARAVSIDGATWTPRVTPTSVRVTKKRGRTVTVKYAAPPNPPPPPVTPPTRPALRPSTVSAGRDHTCAIDSLGQPWCWGAGTFGQLGDGDNTGTAKWQPVAVARSLTATSIAAGDFHTCALANGVAWCWGDDNSGQLGDDNPTTFTSYVPVMVAGSHSFKAIDTGGQHSCALDTSGKAWCWGEDEHGQVGDGPGGATHKYAPVAVSGDHTFTTISAGWASTCALDTADHAWCWGDDSAGQLGDADGSGATKHEPVAVAGGLTYATISAGGSHTCALGTDGAAWCWGQDTFSSSGGAVASATVQRKAAAADVTPATVQRQPVAVTGGHTFASLSAGGYHTCAIDTAGKAWCWGENGDGRLGTGDPAGTDSLTPVAVAADRRFAAISAGDKHSCAVDTSGAAWSWGWYYQGRLGIGEDDKSNQYAPAAVVGGHTFAH